MARIKKTNVYDIKPDDRLVLARPVILGSGVKGYNAGVLITDKVISTLKKLCFSEVWTMREEDFVPGDMSADEEEHLSPVAKFQIIKDDFTNTLADIMSEKDKDQEILRVRNMTRGNVGILMQSGALTVVNPDRPSSEIKVLKRFSDAVISTEKLENFLKVCRDLLEKPFSSTRIDKLRISLADNRTESSYLFNHLANCGLYFLAAIASYNADLKKRGAVSAELKYNQSLTQDKRRSLLFYFTDDEILSGALGSFMHDVGYLHSGMPEVLYKIGPLSQKERDLLKKHVEVSMNILQYHTFFENKPLARHVIENHHERLDGSGYPKRKNNFHVFSRLLGIIDCFDSMTMDRTWRKKFARSKVLEWIYDNSAVIAPEDDGRVPAKFDRELVLAFEKILLLYEIDESADIYHVKSPLPVFKCIVREQNSRPDRPIVELVHCYQDPERDVKGKIVNLLSSKELYIGESTDFCKDPVS